MSPTRRDVLRWSAGLAAALPLAACGDEGEGSPASADAAPPDAGAPDAAAPDAAAPDAAADPADAAPEDAGPPPADATPECLETEDNLEGPFYTPGAPMRADLTEPGLAGTRLTVSGRVFALGCAAPLAGALLDVWQADADGAYDTEGFRLRGRFAADAQGRYTLRTIVPGRYLNGRQYRPAHVHVKVGAPGFPELTTQLYFEGDPFNDVDELIEPSLIMALEDDGDGGRRARFDFVLAPRS